MKIIRNTFGLGSVALSVLLLVGAPNPIRAAQGTPPSGISARGLLPLGAGGWLGVSIDEVAPDKAKQMKQSDVYGVVITEVGPDSPAAKAGLKPGDVITEYNGQRVEGKAEFRRMVRETPPGHIAHISVWRDGHMQKMSLEIGQAPELDGDQLSGGRIPTHPDFGDRPELPEAYGRRGMGSGPALGVSAQDLSGQLGEFFGVPDGEGVLVTDVHKGSAGEKAGLHAGDVITKVDGQRVHNMGELRDRLRDGKTVTLFVLRKGVETALTAEPQVPQPPQALQPQSGLNRRIPL